MKTSISWAEHSINPIRARHKKTGKVGHYCEKIAPGCARCYSSDMQKRFGTPAFGSGQHRDEFDIFLDESKLDEVRRRKKPTRYFWCSMTDFFGDWMESDWLSRCFDVMDATPQHHHMLLTKRPGNIRRMWQPGVEWHSGFNELQPLRHNVHLYYSASDQPSLESGIGELLACRDLTPTLGLSLEPLVGEIDLRYLANQVDGYRSFGNFWDFNCENHCGWRGFDSEAETNQDGDVICPECKSSSGLVERDEDDPSIDHIIIGGESGPNARPCNVAWIRSLVRQCRDAGTAVFLKQLGANCIDNDGVSRCSWPELTYFHATENTCRVKLRDRKGGDMTEFPEDLRYREFPKSFEGAAQ